MVAAFVALTFLLASLFSSVQAQTTPELFDMSVQAGSSYRTTYSEYLQARNQHIQYNTAATRLSAIEKTVAILNSRNKWHTSYLQFLRQTLAEATNIANYPQTVTYLNLETEIKALQGLNYLTEELDSLTKVTTASQAWEARLVTSDKLTAGAKMQIASARLAHLQTLFGEQLQKYEEKVGTPSANMKSTLDLINQKLDSSLNLREKIDGSLTIRQDVSSFRQSLQKVHQDLAEASRLLLELEPKLNE